MKAEFEVLETTDEYEWLEMLDRLNRYDIYHLPSYSRLSEISDNGKAFLIKYARSNLVVVFPLILRKIDTISGLENVGQGWYDAVSAYGYAGPLATRELSQSEKRSFWGHMKEYFDYKKIVSVFSSIHPLFGQEHILKDIGETILTNPTVSIDLSLPPEDSWRYYRKRFKSQINQLKREGYICREDQEKHYWDEFRDLYYESMNRVNAKEYYFFPEEYFSYMKEKMSNIVKLFICFYNNNLIHAATVTLCKGIIQYHLVGAVKKEHTAMGPGKLLIDTIRLWGIEKGAHTFHLGRGLGGALDTLLHFKKGFTKREHPFYFWRLVNNNEIYANLIQELCAKTRVVTDDSYFPLYRHPIFTNKDK